jgi:protoporphyrin/coproporphyrin ferrochelatase
MTGVLLVNMGGARSREEMKDFLACMFKDPRILPFGKVFRNMLSFIISNARYKKSWKKYELIGGTPIIDATQASVLALQTELDHSCQVKMAFSYTSPTIEESLLAFKHEGITKITVIPLYPQASFSTTGSVQDDVQRISAKEKVFDIRFENEFYHHPEFINFWSGLIRAHIKVKGLSAPYLLFSAHSIPRYMVDKGDTYSRAIAESAALIAGNLGLGFEVTFQSGMGGGKWIGPDVKASLRSIAGKAEIVIIPISFVNENLETLYDLDKDIIPFAKRELGIKQISRVKIPEAAESFISLLASIVRK